MSVISQPPYINCTEISHSLTMTQMFYRDCVTVQILQNKVIMLYWVIVKITELLLITVYMMSNESETPQKSQDCWEVRRLAATAAV